MASLEGSENQNPPSSTKQPVTLSSWTRLKNAPLLLPRASAVYWNEYLVILTAEGKVLLFNSKLNMWSMLPAFPSGLPQELFSIILHNNKLTTGAKDGCVYYYDEQEIVWKKHSQTTLDPRFKKREEIVALALTSYNSTLFASVGEKNRKEVTVQKYCNTGQIWSLLASVETTPLHSVACVGDKLFVIAGDGLKKIVLTQEGNKPVSVQSPPAGVTLHSVKDTLFSFGGRDQDNQPLSDVLRYNMATDKWENAGYMRSSRYNTTVVTVQQAGKQELFVIGGSFGHTSLKMKPSLFQQHPYQQFTWDASTCIIEKCTVD